MDGRGMPAVFDGFVERWNRAVERELRRELAEGERKEKLLVVSRGEGDGRRLAEQARSVERIRKRLLLKDHIRLLPLEDVPDGLEWQTGMEEPDVGDPRAVRGGKSGCGSILHFPELYVLSGREVKIFQLLRH